MRLLLSLVVLWLFGMPAHAFSATELRFLAAGVERRAVLVNEAPQGEVRPVVIVLHGGRGSAEEMRHRTGFDDLAVSQGFSVVFAEGTEWGPGQHAWNTGYLQRRHVGQTDDVAYFDALIDLLLARHRADASRIYMTGGSNGAMMTFAYAARRPERLAAIAPIVGAMFSFDVRPSTPVPIMMINGAMDNEVPLEGGMSRNSLVARAQAAPFKSLEESLQFWIAVNGSDPQPRIDVSGTVTTRTYAASDGAAPTISIVDAAGGHGWPGSPAVRAGNWPIQAFRGADRVWEFFRTQRRAVQ
jgi:polyhydroxybutyrate depolymerase